MRVCAYLRRYTPLAVPEKLTDSPSCSFVETLGELVGTSASTFLPQSIITVYLEAIPPLLTSFTRPLPSMLC